MYVPSCVRRSEWAQLSGRSSSFSIASRVRFPLLFPTPLFSLACGKFFQVGEVQDQMVRRAQAAYKYQFGPPLLRDHKTAAEEAQVVVLPKSVAAKRPVSPPPPPKPPVAARDSKRFKTEARNEAAASGACFRCGKQGHLAKFCPEKISKPE